MTNAIDQTTVGYRPAGSMSRSNALVLATDGTAQSDAAISLARLIPFANGLPVEVLTVVEHPPVPWGAIDSSLVGDYERGLREEAHRKASAQLRRLGDSTWQVEVRTGNPATAIAAAAKESGARLIIVGLGGHGPASRFFGNETALHLMRMSQTPVLAVDTKTRGLPTRILAAIDFSESSIEAARLAMAIAAPGASLTLVHVVPWERKEYIPENWFRDHEAYIAGQLKRVAGWLTDKNTQRIHQRILYGKPGAALLACAEEVNADLIVAGTHGRSFIGRILGGQTVSKLVRGGSRSVLVFPHAAALPPIETLNQTRDDAAEWAGRLDEFSRRNRGRRGRLEIDDPAMGAQVEMTGYRFLGASYDRPSQRALLMFGNLQGAEPHLVRGISNIRSIEILSAVGNDVDSALSIVNDDGQTLLLLESASGAA